MLPLVHGRQLLRLPLMVLASAADALFLQWLQTLCIRQGKLVHLQRILRPRTSVRGRCPDALEDADIDIDNPLVGRTELCSYTLEFLSFWVFTIFYHLFNKYFFIISIGTLTESTQCKYKLIQKYYLKHLDSFYNTFYSCSLMKFFITKYRRYLVEDNINFFFDSYPIKLTCSTEISKVLKKI